MIAVNIEEVIEQTQIHLQMINRQTDGQADEQMDGWTNKVKQIYPLTTTLHRGYNKFMQKPPVVSASAIKCMTTS